MGIIFSDSFTFKIIWCLLLESLAMENNNCYYWALIKSQILYTHYTIYLTTLYIKYCSHSFSQMCKLGDRQVKHPFSDTLLALHNYYLPFTVASEKSEANLISFPLIVSYLLAWMLKRLFIFFWSPVKFNGIYPRGHSMSDFFGTFLISFSL